MAEALDASSSEEIETNNNAEKEMVVIEGSGGGNTTTRKRRKAGEVSGRQTALKDLKKRRAFSGIARCLLLFTKRSLQ